MLPAIPHPIDSFDGNVVLIPFDEGLIITTLIEEIDDDESIVGTTNHLEVRLHLPGLGEGVMNDDIVDLVLDRSLDSMLTIHMCGGNLGEIEVVDSVLHEEIIGRTGYGILPKSHEIGERSLSATGETTNHDEIPH